MEFDIRTELTHGGWFAYDDLTYDGAPDGGNQHAYGATPYEAARNLITQIEEDNEE